MMWIQRQRPLVTTKRLAQPPLLCQKKPQPVVPLRDARRHPHRFPHRVHRRFLFPHVKQRLTQLHPQARFARLQANRTLQMRHRVHPAQLPEVERP